MKYSEYDEDRRNLEGLCSESHAKINGGTNPNHRLLRYALQRLEQIPEEKESLVNWEESTLRKLAEWGYVVEFRLVADDEQGLAFHVTTTDAVPRELFPRGGVARSYSFEQALRYAFSLAEAHQRMHGVEE